MTVKSPGQRRHERRRSEVAHVVQNSRTGKAFHAQRAAICASRMNQLTEDEGKGGKLGRQAKELLAKFDRAFGNNDTERCARLHDIEYELKYSMEDSIERREYGNVLAFINRLEREGKTKWVNWPITQHHSVRNES